MSVTEIKKNIERLKEEYTDPEDHEQITEWETRLSKSITKQRYLDLEPTKEIIAYLEKRYRDIRIKLSSDEGMKMEEILGWHKTATEIRNILGLFMNGTGKDFENLEQEVMNFMQSL